MTKLQLGGPTRAQGPLPFRSDLRITCSEQSGRLSAEDELRAAELFSSNGCLMFADCIDRDLVAQMQEHFLENYAARDLAAVEQTSLHVGDRRYMFTVDLTSPYLEPSIYASKAALPVVRRILGSDCIIQSIGVVCAYPGSTVQHVHRDFPPLFPELPVMCAELPAYSLHMVVPLVDLDESTGTTALWAGSHLVPPTATERTAWASAGLNGAMLPWPRMGDCYFMDFRLRHAGTPNLAAFARPILYIVYSRPWFQDRRNFAKQERLLISKEAFEAIPSEYQVLFQDARAY